MPRKIAILHTSFVFISVETVINDLIAEVMPDAEVLHFVDSDVLDTVVREGGISERSEARMVHLAEAAEAAGADIIFSACSSLGPSLDAVARGVSTPVVRIDEAMAISAARTGTRIGVLATVPTTLGPTSSLIEWHAHAEGRDVTVTQQLCEGAFATLMAGDRAGHDAKITDEAVRLARTVDTIVLAQASMNRMADALHAATGVPVLSSPRSGVEYLAEQLAKVPA